MNRITQKKVRLQRRVNRVRFAIRSRHMRPRLVFNRTNRFLMVQVIDDEKGVTICSASTQEKDFSGSKKNKEAAKKLGEIIAKRAKEKGITKIVLDRRGRLYHGRIAEFAEAARSGGLEF